MSDITHWFIMACAVYVAKGIVVALVCAVGLALEREWRWIPFGAFVAGSLWPLTLVAWAIELWEWWERWRSPQIPVDTWGDIDNEPTVVQAPTWDDESHVSAAGKLGGGRR